MDEILLPGWRAELEGMLEQGVTRPRYTYTWSWKTDGTPGLQFGGNKIHARHGFRWKHPVHEVLMSDRIPEVQGWCALEIHHHPDPTKPRSQYLALLKMAVNEDPWNARDAFYYGRELYFAGTYLESAVEFRRFLDLPTAFWKPERAAAMRYLSKVEPENARTWLTAATIEDDSRREGWVELALLEYREAHWDACYENSLRALQIQEKPLDYNCEEFAWGATPWDLVALSAHFLGRKEESVKYGTRAVELDPGNDRLLTNLKFYKE